MNYLNASATISECGLYRYTLARTWDEGKPPVVFCMLNPSTADSTQDDPTIRRCVGFAKKWGFGGLAVVNLFAFRATKPEDMVRAADPVGPENDAHIKAAAKGRLVICAWGLFALPDRLKAVHARPRAILDLIRSVDGDPRCLGLTKNGRPKHPLYLRADALPVSFHMEDT